VRPSLSSSHLTQDIRSEQYPSSMLACGGGPAPVFPTLQRAHVDVGGQTATLR
jgi:hypothetical protein